MILPVQGLLQIPLSNIHIALKVEAISKHGFQKEDIRTESHSSSSKLAQTSTTIDTDLSPFAIEL